MVAQTLTKTSRKTTNFHCHGFFYGTLFHLNRYIYKPCTQILVKQTKSDVYRFRYIKTNLLDLQSYSIIVRDLNVSKIVKPT